MMRRFHNLAFGAILVATVAWSCSVEACGGKKAKAKKAQNTQAMNIVETASENGSFSTLLTAAVEAGLADTLANQGPFTVFAPTDEAFAALPEGTVATLLQPENREALRDILLYHVVSGAVDSKAASKAGIASSLNGQGLSLTPVDEGLMVAEAKVVAADIKASNGIIHVIDRVILPSQANLVETASAAGSFNTLLAAATEAGLADVLAGQGPFTVFAPTDEAFAALPAGTVESLLQPENLDKLKAILTYHVVPGRVFSTDVVKSDSLTPVSEGALDVVVRKGQVMINQASVLKTDINASNGVIHVIDQVLLPSQSDMAKNHTHAAQPEEVKHSHGTASASASM